MTWFKEWFDTKYYHILYKNRDQKEAENFLININNLKYLKKNSKILDIACGKGRHSLFLSKLGYKVDGIDLSKNSINSAKKLENSNLRFALADMRETYKASTYDVALNLFTSFGYFDNNLDNQKCISSMSKNLVNDGILIIDYLNADKTIRNLIHTEKKRIDNIVFNIKREVKDGYIIKYISFIDQRKEYNFIEKVKVLRLKDFMIFLNTAGLNIIDTFGNYNLEKFQKSSSDRLIIVSKKDSQYIL